MRLTVSLLAVCLCLPASAQEDDPKFPVPGLQDYIPKLAAAVRLIGENQVEDAFLELDAEINPAFRVQASLDRFREQWMKLFLPLGRMRLQFESYDVVAYRRVSTQAYIVYGIANGARGPVVFDFRSFRYRGRWHVHGFTFRAVGWEREQKIPADAVLLESPVTYSFGPGQVALRKVD
jgi:hypothetical protein